MNIFVTDVDPVKAAMNLDESWKTIPNYEGYECSSGGVVRSLDRKVSNGNRRKGTILSTCWTQNGQYLQVRLFKDGKLKYFPLHILVCTLYHENPLNLPCVNHIDGIKINNRENNVEWSTQGDNIRHAFRIGLMNNVIGENNHNAKLTKEEVLEIRKIGNNYPPIQIAKMFNISSKLVYNILRNKTWKHI